MAPVKLITLAGVIVLGACSTAAQRRAAETAERLARFAGWSVFGN